jgi:hypothetical protein
MPIVKIYLNLNSILNQTVIFKSIEFNLNIIFVQAILLVKIIIFNYYFCTKNNEL